MDNDFQGKVDEAAINGVTVMVGRSGPGYLTEVMKSGRFPEAVFASKKVHQAFATMLLKEFKYDLSSPSDMNELKKLGEVLRVPREMIGSIVVVHFESYSMEKFPRNFEVILDTFEIPEGFLETEDLKELITKVIAAPKRLSDNELRRLWYILLFFNLSVDLKEKLVQKAIHLVAFDEERDGRLLDKILQVSGLNGQEIHEKALIVADELLSAWDIKGFSDCLDKYDLSMDSFFADRVKYQAIYSWLKHDYLEIDWLIKRFNLTKEDFGEKMKLKILDRLWQKRKFGKAKYFIDFAEVPAEKIKELAISKLPDLVILGEREMMRLAKEYQIPWEKVLEEVRTKVMESFKNHALPAPHFWIENYHLSKEFVESKEVMKAARESLILAYEEVDLIVIESLKRTFNI